MYIELTRARNHVFLIAGLDAAEWSSGRSSPSGSSCGQLQQSDLAQHTSRLQ